MLTSTLHCSSVHDKESLAEALTQSRPDIKLSDPMQNGSGNKTLQARQMSITTAHKFHTCEI